MARKPETDGQITGLAIADFAEILGAIHQPTLLLATDFRVVAANRPFYRTFKVKPDETEGTSIDDLGNRQWNIFGLRELLERILPGDAKIADFEVENTLAETEKFKVLLEAERAYLQEEIKLEYNHETIIGHSNGLKYVLDKVEQIAGSNTTVLVQGETGTGKELAARAIHALSPRGKRALIKVNCATLPADLIESELFGDEKGTFTAGSSVIACRSFSRPHRLRQ